MRIRSQTIQTRFAPLDQASNIETKRKNIRCLLTINQVLLTINQQTERDKHTEHVD